MNDLRDLFHQPSDHPIGGLTFTVHKLQFDQFGDALVLARYIEGLDTGGLDDTQHLVAELQKLADDSPERLALKRTIAGCLSVQAPGTEGKQQLQPDDVDVMPIISLVEAVAVVMEVNADFFSQTLPRLLKVGHKIKSIGLALPNPSSAPATTPAA